MTQTPANPAESEELLSVNAFAKLVGCDEKNIRRYIDAGKLSRCVTYTEGGVRKLRKETALAEWKEADGGARKGFVAGSPANAPQTPASAPSGSPSDKSDGNYPQLNVSKQKAEYYRAEQARLNYEEQAGDLVRKADVYALLYQVGLEHRTNMLSIPDLVVDRLMAAASSGKPRIEVRAILYDTIEEKLGHFTGEGLLDREAEKEPE